jgi:hypothetical protein
VGANNFKIPAMARSSALQAACEITFCEHVRADVANAQSPKPQSREEWAKTA